MAQHPVVRSNDGFDVIGDVHGNYEALVALLRVMGYQHIDSVWQHATRTAIFIGDLIDRGKQQVAVVRLVQAMVAVGSAHIVMGNHEYNAMAWYTPTTDGGSRYCRSHNNGHQASHEAFLQQVVENSALHHEFIEWFGTIPLWLEAEVHGQRLRCVHACWHEPSMLDLADHLGDRCTLDVSGVRATSQKGTPAHDALEIVLKGPELDLGGYEYADKDKVTRSSARVRWWNPSANTLRDATLIPGDAHLVHSATHTVVQQLPDTPITMPAVYPDHIPVVVGHYWFQVPTALCTPYVACVDYSAANDGPLVAYRWSGERELSDDHFVRHTD